MELGEVVTTVDTSDFSWTITSRAPVRFPGADSGAVFLVGVGVQYDVSLTAGEPPRRYQVGLVLRAPEDTVTSTEFGTRCSTYSKSNCLEKLVIPRPRFQALGALPLPAVDQR